MDSVHGSWTRAGVAGPRVQRGLPPWPTARLAGAWPSGHSGPRRLAARVETERAQRGVTGRPLTRARTMVRRWRTDDGASAVERVCAGAKESKGELESEGRMCGSGRGSLGVYIGARGAPERGVMAGNQWC
jgi:hypothetical protein